MDIENLSSALPKIKENGMFRNISRSGLFLEKIHFKNYKFKNIKISGSFFGDIQFEQCVFENIEFVNCELNAVSFDNCVLNGIKFGNLIATEIEFTESKITSIAGSKIFVEEMLLNVVDLSHLNIQESKLFSISVVSSSLQKVELTQNNIKQSSVVESNLSEISFRDNFIKIRILANTSCEKHSIFGGEAEDLVFFKCQLNQFHLKEIDVNRISFHQSFVENADFFKSNLHYGNFVEAMLQKNKYELVSFNNAQFTDAKIRQSTYNGCVFNIACLNRARIENCGFSKSEFYGVDYREASFISSDLRKTKQDNIKTHGAKFGLGDRSLVSQDVLLSSIENWYGRHKVGPRDKSIEFPVFPSGVSRYGA